VRLDFHFRLSLYLTLAAACICLAVAGQAYLPGIFFFAGPVLVLLAVAFRLEGRWAMPFGVANLVGVAIGSAWALWLGYRLIHQLDPNNQGLPLPACLLPDVGPLLMILVLGKLFRPKEQGDWWQLHGLGLMQVGLACVLASGPLLGIALAAYVAAAVWSLTLFYLYRQINGTAAWSARLAPAGADGSYGPPVGVWVVATVSALLLFFLLPRGEQDPWGSLLQLSGRQSALRGAPLSTGFSDQIDLNLTGQVQPDDEVALVVTAEDAAGEPKLDLPGEQRWRGLSLDSYQQGHWGNTFIFPQPVSPALALGRPAAAAQARQPPLRPTPLSPQPKLFDLGPRQYFLTFQFEPRRAGGLFLAEPCVVRGQGTGGPVIQLTGDRSVSMFYSFQGTLVPAPSASQTRREVRYRQVTAPSEEEGLSAAVKIDAEYLQFISASPLPPLGTWTRTILERLSVRSNSGLTATDLERGPVTLDQEQLFPAGVLRTEHWEKVARALSAYLMAGGEYTYSLDLRRQDMDLDPALDFLWNVKEGDCSRYASALTLMLRSQGIAARVVKGFRGADRHDDGTYEVRQSHAHSWVETLVQRPGPEGLPEWHWLTLDPTPVVEAKPRERSLTNWWASNQFNALGFWKKFIVEYDADLQESLVADLYARLISGKRSGWFRGWRGLGVGLALAAAVVGVWRVRRARRRLPHPGTARALKAAFYQRLLALLARHRQLRPQPAQTPREFGSAVQRVLAERATTVGLAELPKQIVASLYRVRYGGETLSPAEDKEIEHQLDRLEAALAAPCSPAATNDKLL
jgi:hypothetical protein